LRRKAAGESEGMLTLDLPEPPLGVRLYTGPLDPG
jgi:hypothetical protein